MKKEINVLFVSIIICSSIGTILPTLSGHNVEQTTDVLIDDCDCKEKNNPVTAPFGNAFRVMNTPIDCTQLQLTKPLRVSSGELPAEFNWKDIDGIDWTTYAKEQGNCGSCWDFAAMGALESRIKISENCSMLQPDLSEQYVLSCLPAAANNYGQGCFGGTPYGAYYYIMNTTNEGNYVNGIIPESCFPYQASHAVSCDEKCSDWMDHLIPLTGCNLTYLGLGYATKENVDNLKSFLYEEGPIAVALNVTSEFINYWSLHHNPDNYFPDTHEPWGNRLNHIVMLVGWKDDPAIANGGYWIVKNSWGTDWGYDGFFNLEYYGLFFGMYYATASYDPESVNWAPVADTGGMYAAEVGEEITFNGTGSVDPEGGIVTYAWEFGDNNTGYGATPTHTYSQQGIYVVSLTVTDSEGKKGTDSALVGVGIDPLLIDATGTIGIDIRIESAIDHILTNIPWSVDISGLVIARNTSGVILALSNQQVFTHHIPLVGLGFGKLSIHIENIQRTERFFVLGPLVFGLRLQ